MKSRFRRMAKRLPVGVERDNSTVAAYTLYGGVYSLHGRITPVNLSQTILFGSILSTFHSALQRRLAH